MTLDVNNIEIHVPCTCKDSDFLKDVYTEAIGILHNMPFENVKLFTKVKHIPMCITLDTTLQDFKDFYTKAYQKAMHW